MLDEIAHFPNDIKDKFQKLLEQIQDEKNSRNWEKAIALSIKANYYIPGIWKVMHNLLVFTIYHIGDLENPELEENYLAKYGSKEVINQAKKYYLTQAEYYGHIAQQSVQGIAAGTLYNLARIQCKNNNYAGASISFEILNSMISELPEHLTTAIAKGERDFDNKHITKLSTFKALVISCRKKHSDIIAERYEELSPQVELH